MSRPEPEFFTSAYCDKGDKIFLHPARRYSWEEIITGAPVAAEDGTTRTVSAVDQNTFRGFHRVSKDCSGAKEGFIRYFVEQKPELLESLGAIGCRDEFHDLSNRVCERIRARLGNVQPFQLESYNKVRKPVDLYLEHLVAMAFELDDHREILVPYLFLPLDSQILASPGLFTDEELSAHGLARSSTYQDIRTEETYCSLQAAVASKAQQLATTHSLGFHPIYFDLIWNNRHCNWGSNLFETNS